jgi:hypothetical protein
MDVLIAHWAGKAAANAVARGPRASRVNALKAIDAIDAIGAFKAFKADCSSAVDGRFTVGLDV